MVADRVGGVAIFTRARAVCFDVRLVDDVKTEIVGDLEEHRVGRIVRSAHRVDVVLLHQHRVFEIVERAHHIALALVCVVVVDALELDLAPVEEEDVALDRDLAKADLLTYALDDLGPFAQNDVKQIQVWNFRRPKVGLIEFDRALSRPRLDGSDDLALAFEHIFERGVFSSHVGVCVQSPTRRSDALDVRLDVPDVRAVVRGQIDIAEDAVVAEHVLRLKIGAAAPLVDEHDQLVLAVEHELSDVELGGVVAPLAVAYVHAVEVDLHARRGAEKGQEVFEAAPCGKLAAIHAQAVEHAVHLVVVGRHIFADGALVRRDVWKFVVKLIADVDVIRLFIAGELPARRHLDLVAFDVVKVHLCRHVPDLGVVQKVPLSAERHHA